jgi:hypothetical protein
MPVDENTGLTEEMGVTGEMMSNPEPRIPFATPESAPGEDRDDVQAVHDWANAMWGTVPRFIQLLSNAPPAAEAWMMLDQKLRIDRLNTDPEYIRHMQLVIVKAALLTQCNN